MSNVNPMPKREPRPPASNISRFFSGLSWTLLVVTVLLPINIFLVRLAAGWL